MFRIYREFYFKVMTRCLKWIGPMHGTVTSANFHHTVRPSKNPQHTLHSRGHTPQNCCLPNHNAVCCEKEIFYRTSNHYVSTIWKGNLWYINLNESFECWVFLKTCFMWFNGVEIYINWQSGSRSLRHERLMGSRVLKLCMHLVRTRREDEEIQIVTSFVILLAPPIP